MAEHGTRTTVVPAEVTALIDERQRIQGWISRLDEFRGETTPDVFERVRGDYAGRLEEVNGKLARHRADLQSSLDEQRGRVAELQSERDDRGAELEEAKLRHAVGELSDAQWERRREESETALEELDEGLAAQRSALEELEGVLAALPGTEPGGAPVTAPVASMPWATAQEGPEPRSEGPEAEPESRVDETSAATVPRAAFEIEDVGEKGEAAKAETTGALDPSSNGDYLDELEFLESLSLDDADRFDAVSAMLDDDDDEDGDTSGEEERSR